MSGTDHGRDQGWGGAQPTIVLVRPQMGENIGAAARAMWNFGLENLRLVTPRDGWPNPKAVAMASGAARVLVQTQVFEDTPTALANLNFVFATTARGRDLTKPVFSPSEAMQQARDMLASGQRVGVMFGAERAGLENQDVVRANALISVPVNPAFGSLNLAQCVLLLAYEWRRLAGETPNPVGKEKSRLASVIEVEALYTRLQTKLDDVGFFFPDHKADSMALNLRNMLSRLPLTDADVRTFHGILRALSEKRPPRG